jgi:hypothetical protein
VRWIYIEGGGERCWEGGVRAMGGGGEHQASRGCCVCFDISGFFSSGSRVGR